MLRKLEQNYMMSYKLSMNKNTTKYIVVGGTMKDLSLVAEVFRGVDESKYPALNIDQSGTSVSSTHKVETLLDNRIFYCGVVECTKIRVHKTVVESITTYGAEIRVVSEAIKDSLKLWK